jgi:hypothetical protein
MVEAQFWSEGAKNIQTHPFAVPVLGGLGQKGLQGQCRLRGTESEDRERGTGPSLWDFRSSLLVHRKCLFIPTKPFIGASLSQSNLAQEYKDLIGLQGPALVWGLSLQ